MLYHMRRIRAVRRQLSPDVTARLVTTSYSILSCRVWTIATPCWPGFQLLRYSLVTVTVTDVLRTLLEDRGCITRVNPYPGARRQNETKCFQITTKQVSRSQQFQLRR